ncbi:KAP family P-loop NTPase fold protein [Desulfitobacterium hafniense]|uniref:KAP family P-loop NTPase fold protein n=1 Tax=Desulfitobacterium hafniense TaxID=49338 RepID=UPI00037CDEC6|nr:P-loop NTPase fold protein [Desulfitobacterium hafniense]
MKLYELQPTHENIMAALADDLINRNKDVLRFKTLLDNIDDSCSIALDGKWGSGKTFFVKQLKTILEAYNPSFKDAATDNYTRIKSRMEAYKVHGDESPNFRPQVAVYYDSWANDNDIDPILSIIYEMIQSVNSDFSFKKGKSCLQIAGTIAEFFTGRKITSLIDLAKAEDPFAKLKEQKNIHTLISEFLESLLAEQGNRLVVFVDELDRCKPSYAVQLLERIKHYFSNDLVTFVFSVNLDQLQHTVKRYYGNDFDACRYLDRFFDLRISLPPADLTRYYQEIGLNNGSYVYEDVCKAVIKNNHFELREITKYYRLAKIAAYKPTHSNSHHFGFADERAFKFCLLCVVPIMIGTKISNSERYNAFVQGKDSSPLIEVMGSGRLGINMCSSLLNRNEAFDESTQQGEIKVKLTDKLNLVYSVLFVQDYSNGTYEKTIGSMRFDREIRDELIRIVSLLSDFSDFDA